MHEQGFSVLVDAMMSQIQFNRIIRNQDQFYDILESEDPNMIKFIESSLQETENLQKIESMDLPVNTSIVTFRSKSAELDLKEI